MLTFQEVDITFGDSQGDQVQIGFPAALKYLSDRGVTQEDINALDIRIVPAQALKQATYKSAGVTYDERIAIVYPHFNLQGQHVDWWSARLVDTGPRPATGFQALLPNKRAKMFCPPNEPVRAYLPPLCDWQFKDNERVYIHESTLKAINGAKVGGKHIGLNGVEGWSSKKHGIALIQELKDIPWKKYKLIPVIVFDSNWDDNDQVALAISRLGARLYEFTGQLAVHLPLPKATDGSNQGFDDFRMAVGDAVACEFLAGEGKPVEMDELEMKKLELNTRVCYVDSISSVVDMSKGHIMKRGDFTDGNYADWTAMLEDDKGRRRRVSVAKEWLVDPRRTRVDHLEYMPGQPQRTADAFNLWKGMGVEPVKGDVQPWLDLMEWGVPDVAMRKWLVQWLAYPLQNLGSKLTSYVLLQGLQGSGKDAIIAPIKGVYGHDNAATIGKADVESQFNEHYVLKQFLQLDEMHGGTDRGSETVANTIKSLVTDEIRWSHGKGKAKFSVRNCTNLVMTTNYLDSVRLDDDDRRAFVLRWGSGDLPNKEFFNGYFDWVERGAAALYHYLLSVDLSGFDPKGRAPDTPWKQVVKESTKRGDELWVLALRDDVDGVLDGLFSKHSLVTIDQLAVLAFKDDPAGVTTGKKIALGKRMHEVGFTRVEIKRDGKKQRFWIVRDRERAWTVPDAQAHLDSVTRKEKY